MKCKVCSALADAFGSARVLDRYCVQYFFCPRCGFVQTEDPFWVEEAYRSPIVATDSGLMERNIHFSRVVLSLLRWGGLRGPVLDYAGGYGVMTRILRDHGVDADWDDRYCENLFSAEHRYDREKQYHLVTAFEVLEHQVDPVGCITALLSIAPNVLVSTVLLPPGKPPQPEEWWYYNPAAGQHISFFSRKALISLAERCGAHCVTWQGIHLFSLKPYPGLMFRLLANGLVRRMLFPLY